MNELERLIEESELDAQREREPKPKAIYEKRVKPCAKAIANFDALPRPLSPPRRICE